MKFWVVNLGCKVNRVESDTFSAEMLARGHAFANDERADLVLVNTCTVTGEAEKKTRKAVRGACASYPHALIVVTGCAAAIDSLTFEEMSDRVLVIPKRVLLDIVHPSCKGSELRDDSFKPLTDLLMRDDYQADLLADGVMSSAEIRAGESFNTRVGIKVQDGCDNECTYCIVHTARGKAYSRPCADIVTEACELARAGVKEIVLSGINLGSYGKQADSSNAVRLADLLKKLLVATERVCDGDSKPPRFRVSSVEPCDIDDDFIEVLATADGRICRHLHLPLQSGSSKVLREMNRPYSAEDFAVIVSKLRKAVPGLSLSTDVIAGFPGETDEEFQETLALCRQCGFSKIHAFPYSMRVGTPAAARLDQISAHVKSQRAAELRACASELRRLDFKARVGTKEDVLVEASGRGLTESYYEIEVPADMLRGSLVALCLPDSFCQ